jgi:hypothetical protein
VEEVRRKEHKTKREEQEKKIACLGQEWFN